jgi:NADPH:quinone reductase-like Zn-dependent oxidoreductase
MLSRFIGMSQVTSQGALSEYIRVRADHVAKKPKNISAVEAAGVATSALTAWQMLFKHAQIKEGDHIFVNGGTTSVGMWAIQIAKANGCRVTATTSGKNYEWLKETLHVDTVRSISPLIPCAYSQT